MIRTYILLCIVLFLSIIIFYFRKPAEKKAALISEKPPPKLFKKGPFREIFRFNLDEDKGLEEVIIKWTIEGSYFYNTKTQSYSKEEYEGYTIYVDFKVRKRDKRVIHKDSFYIDSANFDDMRSYLESENRRKITPEYYFDNFFKLTYGSSYFNTVKISTLIKKIDIDYASLKMDINKLKGKINLKEIENELLEGKHTVLYYRRSWREDVGKIVYSKILGKFILLNSPY